MYNGEDDITELKDQITLLKKSNAGLKSENTLLKVKIRKLNEEIQRRERQIEGLINPRKNLLLKKLVSEKGASLLLNLRNENKELEKMLYEKENIIKRLQHEIKLKKMYMKSKKHKDSSSNVSQKSSETNTNKIIDIFLPCFQSDQKETLRIQKKHFNHKQFKVTSERSMEPIKDDKVEKIMCSPSSQSLSAGSESEALAQNMKIIKNAFDNLRENNSVKGDNSRIRGDNSCTLNNSIKFQQADGKVDSSGNDLDQSELQTEASSEDVKQLQFFFLQILNEIGDLKCKISDIQEQQEKSFEVLKQKDSDLEKLVKDTVYNSSSQIAKISEPETLKEEKKSEEIEIQVTERNESESNLIVNDSKSEATQYPQMCHQESSTEEANISLTDSVCTPEETNQGSEADTNADYEVERLKTYHKLLINIAESNSFQADLSVIEDCSVTDDE